MFPGSLEQYERFNTEIQIIAEAKKIPYVDVFSPLKRAVCDGGWKSVYCYDHFHPNEGGYKIMAEVIADNLIGQACEKLYLQHLLSGASSDCTDYNCTILGKGSWRRAFRCF